jgi:hypothetical protein
MLNLRFDASGSPENIDEVNLKMLIAALALNYRLFLSITEYNSGQRVQNSTVEASFILAVNLNLSRHEKKLR